MDVGLTLGYLSRPIGLRMASPDPAGIAIHAVDHVFSASFLGAVGLTERLEINLALPTVLYQEGAGTADVLGTDERLPRAAVGDVRFGPVLALLSREHDEDGTALAGRLELSLPTGDDDAFVSARSTVFSPSLSLEQRLDRFCWSAEAGGRIRTASQLADARIGTQVLAALGASVDILDDAWLSAALEAIALFTVDPQGAAEGTDRATSAEDDRATHLIPAEWLLSVRSAGLADGRLATSLGGGGPIPTGPEPAVTTPLFRLMAAVHYTVD